MTQFNIIVCYNMHIAHYCCTRNYFVQKTSVMASFLLIPIKSPITSGEDQGHEESLECLQIKLWCVQGILQEVQHCMYPMSQLINLEATQIGSPHMYNHYVRKVTFFSQQSNKINWNVMQMFS